MLDVGKCLEEKVVDLGLGGGTTLGQCPRLGIDIIEQASFRLIKWLTASGCRIENIDPFRRKKSKQEKGKHRAAPQISSAKGRDLMKRGWVFLQHFTINSLLFILYWCPCVSIYLFHLNKHLVHAIPYVVYFLSRLLTLRSFCVMLTTVFFIIYLSLYIYRERYIYICTNLWLCAQVCMSGVHLCVHMCSHMDVDVYLCVCVCTRLLGCNRLIPLKVRHCWNLATGARGLPPKRSWLLKHIHYQPRILGWIKNSCCWQQQKAPR